MIENKINTMMNDVIILELRPSILYLYINTLLLYTIY
jgi:hypothetical protein